MAKKSREVTFVVRFIGQGLTPESVPLRAVSEALSAVQDLASGRDPLEMRHVPPDKTIGLVDVRRGSANYLCVAKAPEIAIENLNRFGALLTSLGSDSGPIDSEHLVSTIIPIKQLSDIAKQVGCRVEVSLAGHKKQPIFAIEKGAYRKISGRLFMKGEASVSGTIERVGGATDMRCLMRVPGRNRLLYCDIKASNATEKKELVRRLGQHLYEEISAVGMATWINRTWYVYAFTIRDFSQPRLGDAMKAITFLRNAGLSAWDAVPDPDATIRELRQ